MSTGGPRLTQIPLARFFKSIHIYLAYTKIFHLHTQIYTTDRKYWISGFEYFVENGFERGPLMLDKQIIPHFKPLL